MVFEIQFEENNLHTIYRCTKEVGLVDSNLFSTETILLEIIAKNLSGNFERRLLGTETMIQAKNNNSNFKNPIVKDKTHNSRIQIHLFLLKTYFYNLVIFKNLFFSNFQV